MIPVAKVFTVTKNEYDLIEDFINFYGTIFGYENVVIIDNGSDNQIVIDVYKKYTPLGITIEYTTGYQREQQGEHFTRIMSKYKESAEFLIGLDTDCFFSVNYRCDKETIVSYLKSLPKDCDIFSMKKFLMSVVDTNSPNYKDFKLVRPTNCTTFVLRDGYAGVSISHVFYRASNFVSTEVGNHNGKTTTNRRHFCNEVAYVHYHDTGKRRHLERCRTILVAYGYINDSMTPAEQLKSLLQSQDGIGVHRKKQYIEYLKNPNTFFREEPIPSDVVIFTEVKRVIENR